MPRVAEKNGSMNEYEEEKEGKEREGGRYTAREIFI